MATDVLRELAQAHTELLTRECERQHMANRALDACPECGGTGRRLLTLEEALDKLGEASRTRVRFYQLLDGTWAVDADDGGFGHMDPVEEIGPNRTRREAAYRLLIEVSRG